MQRHTWISAEMLARVEEMDRRQLTPASEKTIQVAAQDAGWSAEHTAMVRRVFGVVLPPDEEAGR